MDKGNVKYNFCFPLISRLCTESFFFFFFNETEEALTRHSVQYISPLFSRERERMGSSAAQQP